jgi:tetratricopeptide (TPR) repeat protein
VRKSVFFSWLSFYHVSVILCRYLCTQRRAEAETLFKKALGSYHQLAKDNPAVCLPNVAITLNNLGNLVSADTQRRAEAENLFKEALDSYCQLAKDNPTVYLPYVNTLGAFGLAYLNWQEPQQALIYLQEAATILEPFAKQAPELFAEKHAYTLKLIAQAKQPQAQ